jgi:hypothetical protein
MAFCNCSQLFQVLYDMASDHWILRGRYPLSDAGNDCRGKLYGVFF